MRDRSSGADWPFVLEAERRRATLVQLCMASRAARAPNRPVLCPRGRPLIAAMRATASQAWSLINFVTFR